MDTSMDILVTALLDLSVELPELPMPMLIGGGFGLYLKQRSLEKDETSARTIFPGESWAPARTTQDIDLLLPVEVIVNHEHTDAIRAALDRLGYTPIVEFFQFSKPTPKGPLKIDLMTGPVPPQLAAKVKRGKPRVRPYASKQLHAYLIEEALALGFEPFSLPLTGRHSDGSQGELVVYVPNPFTYLLMKLHAFSDRKEDSNKHLGSHHALDIYRIVSMLTRDEYDLVKRLSGKYANSEPVNTAAAIVGDFFSHRDSTGLLRLRQYASVTGLQLDSERVEEFVAVLGELFRQTVTAQDENTADADDRARHN